MGLQMGGGLAAAAASAAAAMGLLLDCLAGILRGALRCCAGRVLCSGAVQARLSEQYQHALMQHAIAADPARCADVWWQQVGYCSWSVPDMRDKPMHAQAVW